MSKLRNLQGSERRVAFFCPGCDSVHHVKLVPPSPCWTFNGSFERPTFTPSILVTYKHMGDPEEGQDERCHSFVTDGRIQFLGDCTHDLAGQTVDLPEWPHAPGSYGGIEE